MTLKGLAGKGKTTTKRKQTELLIVTYTIGTQVETRTFNF